MISNMLVESALRSLLLGALVGFGIWLGRVRAPRLRMTAWTLVLCASLLMPFLMRLRTLEIAAPQRVVATAPVVLRVAHVYHAAITPASTRGFPWMAATVDLYLAVAVLLLVRLIAGLALTFRLWHRATPLREPWTSGLSVRESDSLAAPATVGSTVLLPADWREWDQTKRDAVIAHERSHVRWGDFYVKLLAQAHVVVFWFSPLSWWLRSQITRLAEAASDDAALANLDDRTSYAEVLLDFASRPQPRMVAVAMARPGTVHSRIDRILSGAALIAKAGWKAYALTACLTIGAAAFFSGFSVRAQEPSAPPEPAQPNAQHSNWWWSSDRHGDAWAIVSGDSINMSGSMEDAERARSYRSSVPGAYIWFMHDGKTWLITDPATVRRAQELFRPQEDLGRRQAELGEQQARLGEKQASLGEQQSGVRVRMPALDDQVRAVREQVELLEKQIRDTQQASMAENDRRLQALEKELRDDAGKELTQDQLGALQASVSEVQSRISDQVSERISEIQSRIGDLQSRLGELQSQAGDQQSRFGDGQSKLGEEQSRLGEQQSRLGEEQSRLAEKADRELRRLFDECLGNGLAKPAQ